MSLSFSSSIIPARYRASPKALNFRAVAAAVSEREKSMLYSPHLYHFSAGPTHHLLLRLWTEGDEFRDGSF